MAFEASKINDAVASERSIFSKNPIIIYKRVFRVAVNMYVPIFRGLDARGYRKLRTDTHTQDNHSNDNNEIIRSGEAHTYNIYCTYAKPLIIKHMR